MRLKTSLLQHVARGENGWACRSALGLKRIARADHHDIQERRRSGNADADSTRGHGQMLLSSTGLRRHQSQMQEHMYIDLLLVHDALDYTRFSKIFSVNRSNRQTQTLSLNDQQHARCKRSHRKWNQGREKEKEVLIVRLLASLLACPCEDSRDRGLQGLFEASTFVVL